MSLKTYLQSLFSQRKFKKKKNTESSFSNYLRDYFTFHKEEKSGILLVLILILFFSVGTFAYRFYHTQTIYDTGGFKKQVDEFIASAEMKQDADSAKQIIADEISSPSKPSAVLFAFNPNTATEEDFIKLGLSKKQASGILNYRNKGGNFRKKEDFAKMYTISKEEYQRLEAFLSIPEEKKEEKYFTEQKIYPEKKEYPAKQTVLVEINTSDSLELIKVKGIGPYIAMKIIELRTKLGGFYSKEQLREVYRVDSARYAEIEPFLTVDPFEVKQLNINKATVDELKNHPYIRYNIANSIVSIRQQHGNYKTVDDIKKSHLVTEDVMRKIAPYLTVD